MSRESEWESDTAKGWPDSHAVRWIVDVSRSGDLVTLDDGSQWHVVPSHRLISGNWPRTLRVRVSRVRGRLFTLSAESDRDVQAVYKGHHPVHEEMDTGCEPARDGEKEVAPAAGRAGRERPNPNPPTDAER